MRTLLSKKMAIATLTLAVLGAGCVLLVTDLRARGEVSRATHALTSAQDRQRREQTRLVIAQGEIRTTVSELRTLEASISRTEVSLDSSNAAIASIERGLVFGGFDVSALNTCLGGVTQALDQVAVGQTQGALSSLGTVSPSCNAARPAAG